MLLPVLQLSKPKPQYIFSFVPEKFLVTVCVSPTVGICGCPTNFQSDDLIPWGPGGSVSGGRGGGSADFPSDKFTDKKGRPNGGVWVGAGAGFAPVVAFSAGTTP